VAGKGAKRRRAEGIRGKKRVQPKYEGGYEGKEWGGRGKRGRQRKFRWRVGGARQGEHSGGAATSGRKRTRRRKTRESEGREDVVRIRKGDQEQRREGSGGHEWPGWSSGL
jgi:hypothetical protein